MYSCTMYDQRSVAYTNKNILFVSHVVYQSRTIRIIHEYTERYGGYNKRQRDNCAGKVDWGVNDHKRLRICHWFPILQHMQSCAQASELVFCRIVFGSCVYACKHNYMPLSLAYGQRGRERETTGDLDTFALFFSHTLHFECIHNEHARVKTDKST